MFFFITKNDPFLRSTPEQITKIQGHIFEFGKRGTQKGENLSVDSNRFFWWTATLLVSLRLLSIPMTTDVPVLRSFDAFFTEKSGQLNPARESEEMEMG